MRLFVIGCSQAGPIDADAARRAVAEVGSGLPYFPDSEVQTWTAPSGAAAAASIGHDPAQAGGITKQHAERGRFAVFSGRPFVWDGEETSGTAPLDARFYLEPIESWIDRMDGRCVVARYDDADRTLAVYADPMGAYPVYVAEAGGARWVSNNTEVLRRIAGTRDLNLEALATFLGLGWSLGGDPLWAGVERLPRGVLHSFGPGGVARRDLLPTDEIIALFGAGSDAQRLSRRLVATMAARGDWPGRPNMIPLTGGRDSRVVLAAAMEAGIDFRTHTSALAGLPGYPDTEDVVIARMISEELGVEHEVRTPEAGLDAGQALGILSLASPGTISLGDLGRPVIRDRGAPLPLVHSGLGGEISRSFYGLGEGMRPSELKKKLHDDTVKVWPRSLLSEAGDRVIKGYMSDWVDEHLERGIAPTDLPDLFYVLERMPNWAGPLQGLFEFSGDTSPVLWSHRLLPDQVGQSAQDRLHEVFHEHVLRALNPRLLELPFEQMNHPKTIPAKLRSELGRRVRYRMDRIRGTGADTANGSDPLPGVVEQLRERLLAHPESHAAWDVLSRKRVTELVTADPAGIPVRSRHRVWRLATVFLSPTVADDQTGADD
jgi:hypothetical protein